MAECLEGILILSDPNPKHVERRVEKAVEIGDQSSVYLACGGKTPYLFHQYPDECNHTINNLLARGVSPQKIETEHRSQDTVGNILFSLDNFKGNRLAIVSNSRQLRRSKKIIEAAKEKGLIRNELQVDYVPVDSTPGERFYEFLVSRATSRQVSDGLKPAENYGLFSSIVKSVLMKARDAIDWFYFGFDGK